MLANNSTAETLLGQLYDGKKCQRGNGGSQGKPFHLLDLKKGGAREIGTRATITKWLNTTGFPAQNSNQIATGSSRNINGLTHRYRKRGGGGSAKQGKGKVNQNNKRRDGRVSKDKNTRKRKRSNTGSKKTDTDSQSSHIELPKDLHAAVRQQCLLACPFAKHNPARYTLVHNACTERFGFPSPGKVVEHLKRVHSLSHPCCINCKKRFNRNNMKENQQSLEDHREANNCKSKPITVFDPEWMTEQQEGLFSDRVISSGNQTSEEKWQKIYCFLFPDADQNCLPDPHYDFLLPRHLTEDLINQILQPDFTLMQMYPDPAEIDHIPTATQALGSCNKCAENQLAESETEKLHNQRGLPILPAPSSIPPSAMLTAEALSINDRAQPSPKFQYEVHQVRDSGYESLVAAVEPAGSPEMVMKAVPGAPLDDRRPDLLGLEYGGPEWPDTPYELEDEIYQLLEN